MKPQKKNRKPQAILQKEGTLKAIQKEKWETPRLIKEAADKTQVGPSSHVPRENIFYHS